MFKKLIILPFLLLNSFVFSQISKGKITYQATSNSVTNKKRVKKDITMSDRERTAILELIEEQQPINFHLLFDNGEALFQAEYDMSDNRRLGLVMNYIGFLSKNSYTYYSNQEMKEVLGQNFWTNGTVIEYEPIQWVLTQESKMIGAYKCYKATALITKEQDHYRGNYLKPIEAWYTPEIPVHFGIRHFKGLPGLTLELVTDTGEGQLQFKATKIELNPTEEIKIKKLKGKIITEDAYIKMRQKMNAQRRQKR